VAAELRLDPRGDELGKDLLRFAVAHTGGSDGREQRLELAKSDFATLLTLSREPMTKRFRQQTRQRV